MNDHSVPAHAPRLPVPTDQELRDLAAIQARRDRILDATNIEPAAILVPMDWGREYTNLGGVPFIRSGAVERPQLVYPVEYND